MLARGTAIGLASGMVRMLLGLGRTAMGLLRSVWRADLVGQGQEQEQNPQAGMTAAHNVGRRLFPMCAMGSNRRAPLCDLETEPTGGMVHIHLLYVVYMYMFIYTSYM